MIKPTIADVVALPKCSTVCIADACPLVKFLIAFTLSTPKQAISAATPDGINLRKKGNFPLAKPICKAIVATVFIPLSTAEFNSIFSKSIFDLGKSIICVACKAKSIPTGIAIFPIPAKLACSTIFEATFLNVYLFQSVLLSIFDISLLETSFNLIVPPLFDCKASIII